MQSNERVQPGVSLEVETQRGLNSLQIGWLTTCPEIKLGSAPDAYIERRLF
jgi:hypothetical protein